MSGPGNDHFRVSVSDLKKRRAFSLKGFLARDVVTYLDIYFFTASLSNKIDFFLIELTDIYIVSTTMCNNPLSKTEKN